MKIEELIKLNKLRNGLGGKELSFIELDNYMVEHGYYSVLDDGIINQIKQDESVIYTNRTTNEADIQILFFIVCDNGADEVEESFVIKIMEIEKF